MERNFLPCGVVLFIALAAVIGNSGGRELRPSDHGLEYQEGSPPPAKNSGDEQELMLFFGETTSPPAVELPEAKNISDTWYAGEGRAREVVGRDHVRLGLLVGSAVCGLTGVVLLIVSGVVFLYRLQKQKHKPKGEKIDSTSAALPPSVAHTHAAANKN